MKFMRFFSFLLFIFFLKGKWFTPLLNVIRRFENPPIKLLVETNLSQKLLTKRERWLEDESSPAPDEKGKYIPTRSYTNKRYFL